MDTYRQYQQARDAAWRTLLRFSTGVLPTDVFAIAKALGVETHPDPPEKETAPAGPGTPVCRSLRIERRWHVYFLEPLDEQRQRFALAHELGHIILGHDTMALRPGVRTFASAENQGDLIEDPKDISDYAADIFAIRLLAPACVLHELHIDQPSQVARLCGMPPRAAALRAERMELLNRRDVFGTHPLERQVRNLFLPFLRKTARGMLSPEPPGKEAPASPDPPVLEEKPPLAERPALFSPERGGREGPGDPHRAGARFPWQAVLAAGIVVLSLLILLAARYA